MLRLSPNFFVTSSVYSGDEVIKIFFWFSIWQLIGTSAQNGGGAITCEQNSVLHAHACKWWLPSKTRPDQASHHISTLSIWKSAPVRWLFQVAWFSHTTLLSMVQSVKWLHYLRSWGLIQHFGSDMASEVISEHLIFKFFLGEHAPRPS